MNSVYANMPVAVTGITAAHGSANLGPTAQTMGVGGNVVFGPAAALALAPAPFMGFLNIPAWKNFFSGRAHPTTQMPALPPKAGEPEPGWNVLTRLAVQALRGDASVKAKIEALAQTGNLAQMMLAAEYAAGLISKYSRNQAYTRLKGIGIEAQFRRYRRNPAELSRQSKIACLELNVGLYFSDIGLELKDIDEATLDQLYDLDQLHFFLHIVSGVLDPYLISRGPRLFGHFLTPDTWDVYGEGEGMCHPITVLAVHLGRQVGLPLAGYFSEGHSSVAAFILGGFLYEPLHRRNYILPKKTYVELKLAAPGIESIPDFSLLMLPIALAAGGRTTDRLRNLFAEDPLILLNQARRVSRWNSKKAGAIAEQFLRSFYRSPLACFIVAKALMKSHDHRKAMPYLEEARDGFTMALPVMGNRVLFRRLAICHNSMATCLSKLTDDRQAVIDELSNALDMAEKAGMPVFAALLRFSRDHEI